MKKSGIAGTLVLWTILGSAFVYAACSGAWAESETKKLELAGVQIGDSVRVTATWGAAAPPGDRQLAQAGYETRIIRVGGDTIAAHSVGMQLADTFMFGLPALGDTLEIYGGVATRDVAGNISAEWEFSNVLRIISAILLPNPPGPMTVDTTLDFVLDDIASVIVEPKWASMGISQNPYQFCAFIQLIDGYLVHSWNTAHSPLCEVWRGILSERTTTVGI